MPYDVHFRARLVGNKMGIPQHMVRSPALFGAGGAVGAHGGDFLRRAEHVPPRFPGSGDFRHSRNTPTGE